MLKILKKSTPPRSINWNIKWTQIMRYLFWEDRLLRCYWRTLQNNNAKSFLILSANLSVVCLRFVKDVVFPETINILILYFLQQQFELMFFLFLKLMTLPIGQPLLFTVFRGSVLSYRATTVCYFHRFSRARPMNTVYTVAAGANKKSAPYILR